MESQLTENLFEKLCAFRNFSFTEFIISNSVSPSTYSLPLSGKSGEERSSEGSEGSSAGSSSKGVLLLSFTKTLTLFDGMVLLEM